MSRFTKLSRLGALAAGAALALATVAAPAVPAAAHDSLIGSDPAAGAVLQEAPEQIVLDFSGNLMTLGGSSTLVVVADAEGHDWVESAPVVEGSRVTVPLADGMPGGTYEVSWQVVSEDGHPRSEVFSFTVDAPAAPSEEPADEEPTSAPSAEPEVEDEAPADDSAGLSAGVIAVIVVIAAAVIAVVVIVMRRRGGRDSETSAR
ncbi:copper resistance protein CopC [Salinibacterium sp. dk2585]|uniref:copper resistance CopC family protein n=1 Tax=unclassified Salinibacterium TaxID=2632331 RepID=UPI0011C24D2F|nr:MULTISPECIES: copper resistance CopC family protein [unclassified Salinibacterium]QEE62084.1 copper resistance protein CopC [Salinibacterium sp. dk2585]TXK53436.1 copper resistance protein CopC [Salinibacterium sp. dk5596]